MKEGRANLPKIATPMVIELCRLGGVYMVFAAVKGFEKFGVPPSGGFTVSA